MRLRIGHTATLTLALLAVGCHETTSSTTGSVSSLELQQVRTVLRGLSFVANLGAIVDTATAYVTEAGSASVTRLGNKTTDITAPNVQTDQFSYRATALVLDVDVTASGRRTKVVYTALLAWHVTGSAPDDVLLIIGAGSTAPLTLVLDPTQFVSSDGLIGAGANLASPGDLSSQIFGSLNGSFTVSAMTFGQANPTTDTTGVVRSVATGSVRANSEFEAINARGIRNILSVDVSGGVPAKSLVLRGVIAP